MRLKSKITILLIAFFSQYPRLALADFGCRFIVNQRLSTALDNGDKKISFRFTCREDMDLTAASLFCGSAQDPPAYLIEICTDLKGEPSEEPLGSASIVPRGRGWITVPFGNIPLFGGKIYHLVVEQDRNRGGTHPVGIIGPKNYASFSYTDFANKVCPFDGKPDPKSDVMYFNGKTWRDLRRQPLYALHGGSGHSEGNPYDSFGAYPIFGSGNAEKLEGGTLQGEALHPHCRILHPVFTARIKKKGHPSEPLNYVIYTDNYMRHLTTFSYSGMVLTPDQAPVSYQWVTFGNDPMNPTKPFDPQCTYIGFQTISGHAMDDDTGCDDCYLVSEVGNSGDLPNAAEMTFDGGAHLSRAAFSTDGGKNWFDKFEWDANIVILGPECIEPQKHEGISISTPQPLPKELNP